MHAPDGKRDVETPKWSVASSRVGIVENAAPALTNPQESGVHELARARCKLPRQFGQPTTGPGKRLLSGEVLTRASLEV
jgi:hypothetical protein